MKNDIDRIARLWNTEGRSMGEIAAALGVTRSSISGFINRNRDRFERRMDDDGLKPVAKRSTPVRKPPQTANQRRAAFNAISGQGKAVRAPAPPVEAPVEPAIEPSEYDAMRRPMAKGLMDLEPHECRWPLSDSPFTFCCAETTTVSSYCAHHRSRSAGRGTTSEQSAIRAAKIIARME